LHKEVVSREHALAALKSEVKNIVPEADGANPAMSQISEEYTSLSDQIKVKGII